MEIEKSLRKAEHLLSQDRFGEAQNEIKNYLAAHPQDVEGLVILAQTHMGLGEDQKADQVVEDVLKLDASNPGILYLKGVTQARLGKRRAAMKFLDNALAFYPDMVEAHGAKSVIFFEEAKFEESLEAAKAGLEINPQDDLCLNQVSRALLKLGRNDQKIEADRQALRNNPMNPDTHATIGYGELENGNIQKAKEHFREALRLDPNNAFARQGMMHAIKSTNLYYRLFLKYIFWMQSLNSQTRWAVVIIGYLLIRGLSSYSDQLGPLSAFAGIIITLYMIFAISTWIIGPVSNMFLRFHKFGKYLLDEGDIKTANKTAALLGLSVIGTVIMLMNQEQFVLYNLGLYLLCSGIALTVVISSIDASRLEKSKRNLTIVGSIFGLACFILIVLSVVAPGLALQLFSYIIYGFVGFQFFANTQE